MQMASIPVWWLILDFLEKLVLINLRHLLYLFDGNFNLRISPYLRRTAPEVLRNDVATTKSDVFSYGILVHEVRGISGVFLMHIHRF